MDTLITTILKRPYVFAFFISYLVIATRSVGLRWTLHFIVYGYTIAFISEYLSINYGFPYGWYVYHYNELQGEWLNHGVPVWDSLSYVFMNFAGLYAATAALAHTRFGQGYTTVVLSALLVTLLDVIVDPVSHMGDRWFLGSIYHYPNPGWYFDIPFSNFAGWFLVSLIINSIGWFGLKFSRHVTISPQNTFMALGLYYGIFGFGLIIAVYLQEWTLVLTDVLWLVITAGLIFGPRRFFARQQQYA